MCRCRLAWDAIVAREEQNFTELLAVAPVTEFVTSIFCLLFSTVTGSSGYFLFLLFDVLLMDGVMLAGDL